MELHGDDWDPKWDDAGRKRGHFYDWFFWFIATVFCGAIALLAYTATSPAQDCFTVDMAVADLQAVTTAEHVHGRAWLLPYPPAPQITVMAVWYEHRPEIVALTPYRHGCLILNSEGKHVTVFALSPALLRDIGNGKLIFKNTESSPLPTF